MSQHSRALARLVSRKGVAFQDDESVFGLQDSIGGRHRGGRNL